jgi:hypothetical protein
MKSIDPGEVLVHSLDDWRRDITFSAYGNNNAQISFSIKEGGHYSKLVEMFRDFSLAVGFSPETIEEYMGSE